VNRHLAAVFALALILHAMPARAEEDESLESNAFYEKDHGVGGRGWFALGSFRTAAQTRRGPVVYSDSLVMLLNYALDVNRPGYSLELTSRGLNDFTTLYSRSFNAIVGKNVGERHAVDHRYGSPIDGRFLRVRFAKYVAHGTRWRAAFGAVASDYFHIAGQDINFIDQANGSKPPFHESWFVTAGPLARFDVMASKKIQVRLGTTVGIPIYDLDDHGTGRSYPWTSFLHVRIKNRYYIGIESAVVFAPDVFTQRHEIQFGFVE
jgi:hypothetical protein